MSAITRTQSSTFLSVFASLCCLGTAQAQTTIEVADSSANWLGFMNVFELDGTTYVFGSPWGVADLVAEFDDGQSELTLKPNSIGDPDPFWYIGGGAPGAPGNKIMEANLYREFGAGQEPSISGDTVTFQGNVSMNTFTTAHVGSIFIRDFAPDFSSVVESSAPLAPGPFSISLATIADPNRHVQTGFQVKGVNVWITDVAPFGSAVIETVADSGVGTNYCATSINSTGAASLISATGSSSIAANDLVLTADSLPSEPGIFIAGPTQAELPFFNGFLCVAPSGLQRFLEVNVPMGGTITQSVDYATSASAAGTPGPLLVVAGQTYNYQRWNRDPAAGGGFANFSDGLEILHTP